MAAQITNNSFTPSTKELNIENLPKISDANLVSIADLKAYLPSSIYTNTNDIQTLRSVRKLREKVTNLNTTIQLLQQTEKYSTITKPLSLVALTISAAVFITAAVLPINLVAFVPYLVVGFITGMLMLIKILETYRELEGLKPIHLKDNIFCPAYLVFAFGLIPPLGVYIAYSTAPNLRRTIQDQRKSIQSMIDQTVNRNRHQASF